MSETKFTGSSHNRLRDLFKLKEANLVVTLQEKSGDDENLVGCIIWEPRMSVHHF